VLNKKLFLLNTLISKQRML